MHSTGVVAWDLTVQCIKQELDIYIGKIVSWKWMLYLFQYSAKLSQILMCCVHYH